MPGLSGIDVGVELRRLYGGELPLVFVSAITIPEDELERVDAYLFINKPFNIDDLVQAMASAVREPPPHALLPREAHAPGPATGRAPGVGWLSGPSGAQRPVVRPTH